MPTPSVTSQPVTVNAVTFTGFVTNDQQSVTNGPLTLTETDPNHVLANLSSATGTAPFGLLSANYQDLLESSTYSSVPASILVDMGGLTIGQEYLVQLWSSMPYSSGGLYTTAVSSGMTSTLLNPNPSNLDGGLGQYVIGSFTASGTVATFQLDGATYSNFPLITALQVRAVPEPSSYAIALTGAALGGWRMWRRGWRKSR